LSETVEPGTRVSAPKSQNRVPRVSPWNHPGHHPGQPTLLGPHPGLSCMCPGPGWWPDGGCLKRSKPGTRVSVPKSQNRVPRVRPGTTQATLLVHPALLGPHPGLSCLSPGLGWWPGGWLPARSKPGTRVSAPKSQNRVPRVRPGTTLATLLAQPTLLGPHPGLSCLDPGPGWWPDGWLPETVETGNSCFCSEVAEPCSTCSPWNHPDHPPDPPCSPGSPNLALLPGPELRLPGGSSGVVPDRIERSLFSASQLAPATSR